MEKPRISLIIPAYNEEGLIGKCLEPIERAKEYYGKPSLIETIVVNNCVLSWSDNEYVYNWSDIFTYIKIFE